MVSQGTTEVNLFYILRDGFLSLFDAPRIMLMLRLIVVYCLSTAVVVYTLPLGKHTTED